jgi:hypothetical protein
VATDIGHMSRVLWEQSAQAQLVEDVSHDRPLAPFIMRCSVRMFSTGLASELADAVDLLACKVADLKEAEGAIDEISEGYYKVRQRAKGPWVPVHVWLEDGERDPDTWELQSDQRWRAEWAPRLTLPGFSHRPVPLRQSRISNFKGRVSMAADTQNHSFPPAIAKAVVEVMKALGTLGKEHERDDKAAKYEYASIDDFIQHVRGHCAEAGLAIIPDEARDAETREVTTKRSGKSMVMWKARFAFT